MAKPRVKKAKGSSLKLAAALQFVEIAQKNEGTPFQTHCIIGNNSITAYDGIISMGHKIDEELQAVPHTKTMLNALNCCEEGFSITQLDNERLAIKSGKFDAVIHCLPECHFAIAPDAPIANINESLRKGFEVVSSLCNEKADKLPLASILLQANSVIATNGVVIIEFWHGIDLPGNLILPKPFVNSLLKINKKLTKFGFSQSSITFWFDDESWIKTQLYAETWPDVNLLLNASSNPWPIIPGLFANILKIEPFSKNGRVYFGKNLISSHPLDERNGAKLEVEGVSEGCIFAIEQLKLIQNYVERVDFTTYNDRAFFFGENLRGVVMKCRA